MSVLSDGFTEFHKTGSFPVTVTCNMKATLVRPQKNTCFALFRSASRAAVGAQNPALHGIKRKWRCVAECSVRLILGSDN